MHYLKKRLGSLKKSIYENFEAFRVYRIYKTKKTEEIILVYDYFSSAPGYGNFTNFILLARFFISFNFKVQIYLLNDLHRTDWEFIDKKKVHNDFVNLATELLDSSFFNLKTTSYEAFFQMNKQGKKKFVLFNKRIIKRRPIYNSSWNIINLLYKSFGATDPSKFLFLQSDFNDNLICKKPLEEYMVWHCRKSKKISSQKRNTTDEEFLSITKFLTNKFPDLRLMIISDEFGCSYFKKLASSSDLNLLFSKDYSDSFLGDGSLIVGSKHSFILRGGGIDIFTFYSMLMYRAIFSTAGESIWHKYKSHPWSSDQQISIIMKKGEIPNLLEIFKIN